MRFLTLAACIALAHMAKAASGRIVSVEPSSFEAGKPKVVTVVVENTGPTADFLVLYADSVCNPFNGVPSGWSIQPLKVWDLNFFGDYNPLIPAGATYEATFEVTPPATGGTGTFIWKLEDDGLFCANPVLDEIRQAVSAPPTEVSFGVTVIAHGYNSNADDWVRDMGIAILNKAGRGRLWKFDAATDSLRSYSLSDLLSPDFPRAPLLRAVQDDPEGEQVLLVDWRSTANNTLTSPAGHAEAVGHAVYSLLMGGASGQPGFVGPPGNRKPLHFIGHSFGAVVISEAIQRLGRDGVVVEQMTTLDPHDWDENAIPVDGKALLPDVHIWPSVIIADNYYETCCGGPLNPHGRDILGALNYDLTNLSGFWSEVDPLDPTNFKPHSRIHTFYHGTIDATTRGKEVDGLTVDPSWYVSSPLAARGYEYSRIGGRKYRTDFDSSTARDPYDDPPKNTTRRDRIDIGRDPPDPIFNHDFWLKEHDSAAGFYDLISATVPPNQSSYAAELQTFQKLRTHLTLVPENARGFLFTVYPETPLFLIDRIRVYFDSIPAENPTQLTSPSGLQSFQVGVSSYRGKAVTITIELGRDAPPVQEIPASTLPLPNSIVWVDNLNFTTSENAPIEINAAPIGSGSVRKEPDTTSYPIGSLVMLTATPNDGYFLQGWGGVDNSYGDNKAEVLVSGPRSVVANFALDNSCSCPVQYLSDCATAVELGLSAERVRLAVPLEALDLKLIRRFRDVVLANTPRGKSITEKFYQNSLEIIQHLTADQQLRSAAVEAVTGLQPMMRDLLEGSGTLAMSQNQVGAFNTLIQKLGSVAGVQLRSAIEGELARLGPLQNLAGKTSTEIRQKAFGLPLRISNPRMTVSGGFEFTVSGELTGTLRVEYSDDLSKWTALDLAPPASLPALLRDERPVVDQQRYYRVVVSP